MTDSESGVIRQAVATVLREIIDGSTPEAGWLLNRGDAGLLRSLERLTAEEASVGAAGGATIAAHTDHLRYGLTLLNRTAKGENPFADADWSASWWVTTVTASEWEALLDELRREAHAWRESSQGLLSAGEVEVTGTIASVAHLAYHLGAIRQISRVTRGPAETE